MLQKNSFGSCIPHEVHVCEQADKSFGHDLIYRWPWLFPIIKLNSVTDLSLSWQDRDALHHQLITRSVAWPSEVQVSMVAACLSTHVCTVIRTHTQITLSL